MCFDFVLKNYNGKFYLLIVTVAPSIQKLKPQTCSNPISFADFFKDSPWFNIREDRQAVLLAPFYPRGGLLGGSPDGVPKISKLQALAAARKKKAHDQRSSGSSVVEKPMEKLALNEDQQADNGQTLEKISSDFATSKKLPMRGIPLRKRKDSDPHEKAPTAAPAMRDPERISPQALTGDALLDQAEPSAFASTMFSSPDSAPPRQHPENNFTIPYVATTSTTPTDPFAGPSPDDVVIAAQSKGSTISAKPKTSY